MEVMSKDKELIEKINAKSKNYEEPIRWFCVFCSLKFTSEIQAQQHFAGKKHQLVLKTKFGPKDDADFSIKSSGPSKNFLCKNSEERHSKKSFTNNCVGPKGMKNDSWETVPPPAGRDNILETVIKSKKKIRSSSDLSIFRTPSGRYYCRRCNLTVNSPFQFLQHSESRKHKFKRKNSKVSCNKN